jgi:C1A family cysteine protease
MNLPVINGRRFGAFPSKRRATDLGRPTFLLPGPFPSSFQLFRFYWPAVKDQGAEGSCTGHGWASNSEFLFSRFKGLHVTLSPAGIYYLERQREGTLDQGDCGAQVSSGAYVTDLQGVTPLVDEPYVSGDVSTAPTAAQLAEAQKYRTGAFHRLATVTDIKSCIYSGYPIVIGFNVYDSFMNIGADGLMPMPNLSTESLQGGHCTFGGLAYNDYVQCPGANPGAVLMQNSWGLGWGLQGRYWMPYDFLADQNTVSDIFIQHLGHAWGKPA